MARLSVDGPEIRIEGTIGDLVADLARLTDAVMSAIDKNTDGEIDYHTTMGYFLTQVAKMHKMSDATNDGNSFGYETELEFLQQVRDLRKENEGNPEWYEYDSGDQKPFGSSSSNDISTSNITGGASLGKFAVDARANKEDILDIKRIIEEKKKKRKG